jgi:AbrB family looped-hinge helix DNA binding protein
MKITTKGQVTIPQEIREQLGLLPHTEVDFEIRNDEVVLTKAARGRRLWAVVHVQANPPEYWVDRVDKRLSH